MIFFPIITEGPISRYGQLGEEFKAEHHFDYKQFCFGAQLIVRGLFQKVLLSDRVNMYVRAIFANHEKCYDPENDHKYIDAEDFISQELCTLPEEFFVAMDIAPTMLEQYMIK